VRGLTTPTTRRCGVDPLDVQEATASTVESNHFLASWAVDGHSNSRWASYGPTEIDHATGDKASGPQWLKLDMGEVSVFIDSMEIVWERAYSRNYIIKVSEDGASWEHVRTLQANSEGLVQVSLMNVAARYVKIFSTEGDPNYGISIFEVKIFGDPSSATCAPPPTTCSSIVIPLGNAIATSSTTENDHKGPEKAIDEDAMSRWSSGFDDDQWLAVDLRESTVITSVWLRWEHAYAKRYKVQVADVEFPEEWNTIVEVMEGEGGSVIHGGFTPVVAQHVRIFCEERAMTRYGNSLWEVQVRGNQKTECF
jgi:hexosaminidase